ncbi:hypothetical protein [Arhodomonas sp. AD133]|uniref:hypothetical protein n=1 Tax=Arhodomonas sp. AD133 TaxID=3415009 RepID=UPI003EBE56F4
MPAIRLTDDEWVALADEPPELSKVYAGLKRRMDFESCVVGLTCRISEQTVRELLSTPSAPGRKAVTATRKKVRYAVDALVRLGLLEPQPALGSFVFGFPYAMADQSERNRWGQGRAKVGPEVGPQEGPYNKAGISPNDSDLGDGAQASRAKGGHVGESEVVSRWGQPPESGIRSPSPDGEEASAAPAGAPDCPHQAIIELYHQILPTNPPVKTWNDNRKKYLRARWREDEKRQRLEYWERFFRFIAEECPFLTGQKEGTRGPFTPSLEWLVRPSNFAKIIEGQYREKKHAA